MKLSGKFASDHGPVREDSASLLPGRPVKSQRAARRWTAAVVFVHAVGVALLFDPLAGLWNSQPLIAQDYGLHFHHLSSMQQLWENGQRLWGYNPLFMAGYPSNTIQDASIKLFELAALGLGPWLVARTGFCVHPADVGRAIPQVGGMSDSDVRDVLVSLAADFTRASNE